MPSTHTLPNGVTLSRDAFIAHYVAAWLATYDAAGYTGGRWGLVGCKTQTPLSTALECAEHAWQEIESIHP